MRYDSEWKERTRARVLDEAAKAIRQDGVQGIGVAAVMARAGLTHGGFYAHFESRDDLVAATLDLMMEQVGERLRKLAADLPAADALRAYVQFYLSPRHRDGITSSCPLPLVAADVARLGAAAQRRYAEGVAALSAELGRLAAAHGVAEAQDAAGSAVAEMVGAMTLARVVAGSDRAESDRLLARSCASVLARLGLAPTTAGEG